MLKFLFISLFVSFNLIAQNTVDTQTSKKQILNQLNIQLAKSIVKRAEYYKKSFELDNMRDVKKLFDIAKNDLIKISNLSDKRQTKITKSIKSNVLKDKKNIEKLLKKRSISVDYEIKRLLGDDGTFNNIILFIEEDLENNIVNILSYDIESLRNHNITVFKLMMLYVLDIFKIEPPKLRISNVYPIISHRLFDTFRTIKIKQSPLFAYKKNTYISNVKNLNNKNNNVFHKDSPKKFRSFEHKKCLIIPGAGYVRTQYSNELISCNDNGMDCVDFRNLCTSDFLKLCYLKKMSYTGNFKKGDMLYIGNNHVGICSGKTSIEESNLQVIHCTRTDDGSQEGIIESDFPKTKCSPERIQIKSHFLELVQAKNLKDLNIGDLFLYENDKIAIVTKIVNKNIILEYFDSESEKILSKTMKFNKEDIFFRPLDDNFVKYYIWSYLQDF